MKKKIDFGLILGCFLLTFGTFSTLYAVSMLIIQLIFFQLGFVIYVKDMLFDIIFILLGLIVIRKKKHKILFNRSQQIGSKSR
ncbi:MAG: hypothetical protein ACXAEX_03895 [Promethearchaeota archaeon]